VLVVAFIDAEREVGEGGQLGGDVGSAGTDSRVGAWMWAAVTLRRGR